MTQHITQEQAVDLATRKIRAESGPEYVHELCNAAVQHYLDQHKAELPGLPEIDFGATDSCEGYSESTLQAYGQQCAAHARKLALMDAIKQVTILYEKDDYPVLTDICNLIATAK